MYNLLKELLVNLLLFFTINFFGTYMYLSSLFYPQKTASHKQQTHFLFFSVLDDKAGNLRFQSEKYKKDATYLNLRSSYAKYAAVGTIFVVLMIYIRFWWF